LFVAPLAATTHNNKNQRLTIHDAHNLPDGSSISADVCVVGAGAAGITIARSLAADGARVCLLESGGFDIDEQVQELYDLDNIGYPVRDNFMSRVRFFGGSCNLWAGRSMRLSPIDFEQRDWVPNSGWPVSYEDIEPYYAAAECLLRLPTFADFTDIDRIAGIGKCERAVFESADSAAAVATWGIKPMRFGKVFKRELKRSKAIDVYLNANVTEIIPVEGSGAIERLVVKTLDQRKITVAARTFVLAAGGLENARLLLASTAQNESGVGNENDLVGRYYLDHPRAIYGRVQVNSSMPLPYLTGIPLTSGKIQFGIATSDRYQREHNSLNCYASLEPALSEFAETQYGRSINVLKVLLRKGHAGSRFRLSDAEMSNVRDLIYVLTPKEIMPHFVYRPYALLKQWVRRRRPLKNLSIINYCEQVPDPESRVTLGPDVDALGMRKLRLRWRVGDDERRSVAILHEAIGKLLNENGIGELQSDTDKLEELQFTDASHHIGTTRMSESPKTGVVDRNCRVHGVDNLYICSSSVFPTGGYANPTSTIVALTLRLADHLKQVIPK